MDPKLAMRRPPAKFAMKPAPEYPLPSWWEDAANVLYCDWDRDYWVCPTFSDFWANTQFWGTEWPRDYKVLNKKLFHLERLCVPKNRVVELIDSHHRWNAHQGEARLLPDLHLHYEFPQDIDVQHTVRKIKQSCLVCQQCEAPNFSLSGPISMTPVPPGSSPLSLWIFSACLRLSIKGRPLMLFFFGWTVIAGGWSQDPPSTRVALVKKQPNFFLTPRGAKSGSLQ